MGTERRKPSILQSKNSGKIHLTKRDGKQVADNKINTHESKNVTVVWKNLLGGMTKKTT